MLAADERLVRFDFAREHRRVRRSFIVSRMRWSMNHAVFCVTPSARPSSCEDVPFFVFARSQTAGSHLLSGIGLASKIVPTLAVKSRPHSLHRNLRRLARTGPTPIRNRDGAGHAVRPPDRDEMRVRPVEDGEVGDGFEERARRPSYS